VESVESVDSNLWTAVNQISGITEISRRTTEETSGMLTGSSKKRDFLELQFHISLLLKIAN
jgi:hypothetical protein